MEFSTIVKKRMNFCLADTYKKTFHFNEIVIFLFVLAARYVVPLSFHKISNFFANHFCKCLYFLSVVSYIHHVLLYSIATKYSVNIEENPGPKPNSFDSYYIRHWNLNSIFAHNFIKSSLFCAHTSISKSDITCISETYLGLRIPSEDNNLELPGYNLVNTNNTVLKNVLFAFINITFYP